MAAGPSDPISATEETVPRVQVVDVSDAPDGRTAGKGV